METKNVLLKVRVTESESKHVNAAAHHCGLTQSAYIRMILAGRQPKPIPPPVFWEHMDILYIIHNGLRNIANSGGEDSELARELQESLQREILRVQTAFTLPERSDRYGDNKAMGDQRQPAQSGRLR